MLTKFDVGDTVLVPMRIKYIKADKDGWYYIVSRAGTDIKVTDADIKESDICKTVLSTVNGLTSVCRRSLESLGGDKDDGEGD